MLFRVDDISEQALIKTIYAANSQARSAIIGIPAGTYSISKPLPDVYCDIQGEGRAKTILAPIGDFDCLTVKVPDPYGTAEIKDIGVTYPLGIKAGTAITMRGPDKPPWQGFICTIERIYINYAFNGIAIKNIGGSEVSSVSAHNIVNVGLSTSSENNPDAGDNSVTNCDFMGVGTTGIGILWHSGGGFRARNCKVGNQGYGIVLHYKNASGNTEQFTIEGCIFDTSVTGISVSRDASALHYLYELLIVGNMFSNCTNGIVIPHDSVAPYFSSIGIFSNSYMNYSFNNGSFVSLDSIQNFMVCHNVTYSANQTNRAYVIGPGSAYGVIGPNQNGGLWAPNINSGTWIAFN